MFVRDLSNKDVLTIDGHKLGQVVNLVIDIYTGDVDLVIFPNLVTKLVRDHAGNISGQITGAAISTLKQFIPGIELADMIVDQAGGYAGMRASGKVKTMVNVIQESYYLVPAYFLSKIDHDQMVLGLNPEDCKKWCLNTTPMPECQVSFYNESHYSGPKRPVASTINTTSIEGLTLEDGAGIQTAVKDVLIDSASKRAEGIIVNDPRSGVNRIVQVGTISIGGDKLITSSRFDNCRAI